jgi:tRNA pseudouridine55 synthase
MTIDGVLVLDKPTAMSSARAVELVKRRLGASRAGHGGTLDPLATGVLPIALGAATKLAAYLLADDKAYAADGVLGVTTDTLDRTGAVTATCEAAHVTRAQLAAAIAARVGEHDQLPPMYSAIKQGGVRLYRMARAGAADVERATRRIRIDRCELVEFAPPRFRIVVECSKGTYIRSLVADLGTDLGVGAHLAELRRTRSGRFAIAQAITLAEVERGEDVTARLIPPNAVTSLPQITVPGAMVPLVFGGVQMSLEALGLAADAPSPFLLVDEAGELLALARCLPDRIAYDRVFGRGDRA